MSKNTILETAARLITKQSETTSSMSYRQAQFDSFTNARNLMGEDVAGAFDAYLLSNPLTLHELNRAIEKDNKVRNFNRPLLNYNILGDEVKNVVRSLDLTDEQKETHIRNLNLATNVRASGNLDTITNPGGANLLQTTVADYFVQTIEDLSVVYNSGIIKRDMTNGGNSQQPTFSNFGRSTFVEPGTNYVNLGTSIEGGISSVTLNPKPYGAIYNILSDFQYKLNTSWIKELLDVLAGYQAREKDYTILFGTASLPDYPTGMANGSGVVTGLTAGANEFETLGKYISKISQNRKVSRSKMALYINESINQRLIDLKYQMTNDDMSKMIALDSNGNISMIRGVKTYTTEIIPVTSGTSTLVIGVPTLYMWGYSKQDKLEEDRATGFDSDSIKFKVSGYADGKPVFGNAFGKFDVTGL
jgi:hypothetical protein